MGNQRAQIKDTLVDQPNRGWEGVAQLRGGRGVDHGEAAKMPFGGIERGLVAFDPAKEVDHPPALDDVGRQIQPSLAAGGIDNHVELTLF